MPYIAPEWLQRAVADFGRACKEQLQDGVGEPEAAIRPPIEKLLTTIGEHSDHQVVAHGEAPLAELGIRPDYAIRVDGAVTGYLEAKKPDLSLDPSTFRGHNKRQWEQLRDLPDLIYTPNQDPRTLPEGNRPTPHNPPNRNRIKADSNLSPSQHPSDQGVTPFRLILAAPVQVLPARPVNLMPAEVGRRPPAGGRYGSARGAVAAQLAHRDAQLLRQPGHHGGRCGGHVVRDVPQPRKRAQLHRRAQHVLPAAELPDERLISRREREVPDQLGTGRLRKPAQLRQLIL